MKGDALTLAELARQRETPEAPRPPVVAERADPWRERFRAFRTWATRAVPPGGVLEEWRRRQRR